MKKKIAKLLEDSRLIGNANLDALQKAYRLSKTKLQKAKTAKTKAKLALQNLDSGEQKKEADTQMALRTAFQQAKAMQQFHRLGYELAKFRLVKWLENWGKEIDKPQEWVLNSPEKEGKKDRKAAKLEIAPEMPAVPKKKSAKTAPKKEKAPSDTDA